MKEKIEIQIMSYIDDDDNVVYDFEGMAEEFENELSKLDESVVIMCSVETKECREHLI
jgi:hypothetical protein